jgi:glycosyltransferase involved in cell wall biosynthesis
MKLSIVVPVRNEHETIVPLIHRVLAVDYGMPKEVIVVDGASTDGTREALLGMDDSVEMVLVLEDQARGKGRAVRTGFERASGDIVIVQDADLELDPGQIPMLLEPLVRDGVPVVFGSRFKGKGRGSTPLVSYAGNVVLTWAADVLFLSRMTDILTCYKAMWAEIAKGLELQCDGFDFDAEITCRLLRDGYPIIEMPVTYDPRSVEEGKKLTPRVGWSVLRAILRVRASPKSPSTGKSWSAPARSPISAPGAVDGSTRQG